MRDWHVSVLQFEFADYDLQLHLQLQFVFNHLNAKCTTDRWCQINAVLPYQVGILRTISSQELISGRLYFRFPSKDKEINNSCQIFFGGRGPETELCQACYYLVNTTTSHHNTMIYTKCTKLLFFHCDFGFCTT